MISHSSLTYCVDRIPIKKEETVSQCMLLYCSPELLDVTHSGRLNSYHVECLLSWGISVKV